MLYSTNIRTRGPHEVFYLVAWDFILILFFARKFCGPKLKSCSSWVKEKRKNGEAQQSFMPREARGWDAGSQWAPIGAHAWHVHRSPYCGSWPKATRVLRTCDSETRVATQDRHGEAWRAVSSRLNCPSTVSVSSKVCPRPLSTLICK